MEQKNFYSQLKNKIDGYVQNIYALTRNFPREEIYGITSQLRRSSLSVALNFIEGYARGAKSKTYKHFLDIAYGSLQESKYLIDLAHKEGFRDSKMCEFLMKSGNEIGAIFWGISKRL